MRYTSSFDCFLLLLLFPFYYRQRRPWFFYSSSNSMSSRERWVLCEVGCFLRFVFFPLWVPPVLSSSACNKHSSFAVNNFLRYPLPFFYWNSVASSELTSLWSPYCVCVCVCVCVWEREREREREREYIGESLRGRSIEKSPHSCNQVLSLS